MVRQAHHERETDQAVRLELGSPEFIEGSKDEFKSFVSGWLIDSTPRLESVGYES